MFKNQNIKSLTVLITVIITAVNLGLLLIYFVLNNYVDSIFVEIGILLLIILFNSIFVKRILDTTVFDKIKIIYKVITGSKLSTKQKEEIDLGQSSLDQVQEDVALWAQSADEELQSLKTLENYRKDFVGNISHELKTPLFSIQGYLHTLLDGGLYDEKINKKYIQRAAYNVDRLQSIVDDLEVINKLESNQLYLQKTTFNLKNLFDECFGDLKTMAKERGITLSYKAKIDENTSVKADYEGITKVINNLIVNSIKYGSENGTTTVGFFGMDKKVLVEITDDGDGIEEKHLKHLFDRFYRIDSNRSRKIGGSGLGLSIVKHILDAHNQKITVRSTPGIGTTFGFTLDTK